MNNSQNITIDFLREVAYGKLLEESNILPCYGISQDPQTGNYLMVTEYVDGGNLRKYLSNNLSKLEFDDKLIQLQNIAFGLYSIHKQGLVHRDLHSGNILVSESGEIKITDLGLCKPVNETSQEEAIYGVLPYVAPEVLQGKSYTQASDTYSFGIVAYEMLSGLPPYYDWAHDQALAVRICEGLRPEFKIKIPQLLENLVRRCWDADPQQRPTTGELSKILGGWYNEMEDENTVFARQVREAEEYNKTLPDEIRYPNYQAPEKILHSKLITTRQITQLLQQQTEEEYYTKVLEELDLSDFNLDKLTLQEDPQEQSSLQSQIQIPPK